jgi:hypothetical protein
MMIYVNVDVITKRVDGGWFGFHSNILFSFFFHFFFFFCISFEETGDCIPVSWPIWSIRVSCLLHCAVYYLGVGAICIAAAWDTITKTVLFFFFFFSLFLSIDLDTPLTIY